MFGKKKQEVVKTPEQIQDELLKEATKMVRTQHYYMMEALTQKKDFDLALGYCSLMLHELRTSDLTPKNYYKLYMLVFDKLRDLQLYLKTLLKQENVDLGQIYERVQYDSSIVCRLYLTVTVGVVYIESKQVRASSILKDMVDLCKGVQHPIRGLFLRHHLSSVTKNLIPDINSEYGGTIADSINYVMTNFNETVNLFSRLAVSVFFFFFFPLIPL